MHANASHKLVSTLNYHSKQVCTLDSEIGLRSLIFEKFEEKKWPQCLDWCKKSIKIVMWKFLRFGVTDIPGATFIPRSRVDL